ncbi:hypothetical protein ACFX2A_038897 [Malus domestica]
MQSMPIYVFAPYKYRGTLNMMFQLSITLGILAAGVINYLFAEIKGGWGWRLSLGSVVAPAIMIIIGALVLPETPNTLVERGKNEEAKPQLLRGFANIDKEFDDLLAANDASKLGWKEGPFLGGWCSNVPHSDDYWIAMALKFGVSGNPGVLSKGFAHGLVVCICIYVAGFAWSVPSELFPLEVRSAAQSINVSTNMIFTFAIAQDFTIML